MATQAQISANRRNAAASTGPRTSEGKAASSRNALKHGLTSETPLLPHEDATAYDALVGEIYQEISPKTSLDAILTLRLANLIWRLRRIATFEAALVAWTLEQQQATFGDVRSDAGAVGAAATLKLGRCLAALFDKDFTCKLSRYEAHLSRQVRTLVVQLAK